MSADGYLRAEFRAIYRFRHEESIRQGRLLSRNEAAELWIERYAESFRKQYVEEQTNGRVVPKEPGATVD